ncbi:MAG: hypothetical protein DRN06_01310 [Thermoprotei archaeon]|nr:MAG: hypothetical protein DRN06_01310 [Thermoprotei archaeon]
MKLEALSRHELLACMQCGVCVGSCPLSTRSTLNVRRITASLMTKSLEVGDELWDCTTCYLCVYRCPRGTKPLDLIIELRSERVEAGKIPPTLRDSLENTFKQGNPWGKSRVKRGEWASGLGIKRLLEHEDSKILLFTCCASAYDPRAQEAARALVKVLKAAGVEPAFLGEDEVCCGNEVYNIGELGLFEELMETNKANMGEGVETIITTSPHCYYAFKNRYLGLKAEVLHYTQFLARLLDEGLLKLKGLADVVVTYHDPCYLGRRSGVYEEPRKLLKAIRGVKLVEMERSRSRSLCCEGGGGRMWFEGPPGRRLAEVRVVEASSTGASILATACPFCLANLEDGVKTAGLEDKLRVMDVAELLAQALPSS